MIKAALFAKLREWHTEFGKWGYKTTKNMEKMPSAEKRKDSYIIGNDSSVAHAH